MSGLKGYLANFSVILRGETAGLLKLLLMFASLSLIDLLGIGLVGGYISILTQPIVEDSRFIALIRSTIGAPEERERLVVFLGVVLLCIFMFKAFASIYVNYKILSFSQTQVIRLRSLMVRALQTLPYERVVKRSSAEYVQRSQAYVSQFNSSLVLMLRMISEGMVLLVILVFLATVNFVALASMGLLSIAIFLLYDRLFRQALSTKGREANLAGERLVNGIQESFHGIKEIRILGKERFFFNKILINSKITAKIVTFVGTVTLAPRFVIELAIVLFVVILVVVTFLQSTSLEASYPLIGMFGVAALRLAPGITMVLTNVSVLRNQQHGVSVIAEDLSSLDRQNLDFGVSFQSSEREQFSSLKLDRVTFAYDQESDPVLKEVVLSIEAGECVGLIGASGSGKTTLVDVMLGLLEPQEGEISFNGRPLPLALNAWQSNIAYLPQEVFLISGTIRENIALGCEPHEIDENLIQQSLRQAQLNELVGLLPHGVNTHIGERGVRLSGGQRQRIALARALYHKREILVLDEATSALDDDTEREIVKEIQELKGEKTMIVIAHRLTTLRHCDRIHRLDKGRIVESGPYEKVVLSAGKSDRRQQEETLM